MPKQAKIFVSYAHEDAATAREVVQALTRAGLDVWIDQKEIQPGASFVEKMNEGLDAASYVVLLVSPASQASKWVEREWMSTLATRDTVLLPVRVAPVELPRLLRDLVYIDLVADKPAGLKKLVEFFRKEREKPSFDTQRGLDPSEEPPFLRLASRREIRHVAKRCMDQLAFKEFLFDNEIDEGRIAGDSLHERLINLLHLTDLEGTLELFLHWLEQERGVCVRAQLKKLRSETDPS